MIENNAIARAELTPQGLMSTGASPIRLEEGMTLADLYRRVFTTPYPKFHKMDALCKAALICAECVVAPLTEEEKNSLDIIAFTVDGCLASDMAYTATLQNDNFFPSPAVFVYTLPNILTGELAIRHKARGETSLYAVRDKNDSMMDRIIEAWLKKGRTNMLLAITADAVASDDFFVKATLIKN